MIEPVTGRDEDRLVVYTDAGTGETEQGVVVRWNDAYVFVRYGQDQTPRATERRDLKWVAEPDEDGKLSTLAPFPDEAPEDDYKGSKGWVIVAVGDSRSCVLDVDPGFGSLRWLMQEIGLHDPDDELGLDPPDDPGVYKGTFETWTTSVHDFDGSDNDMGFTQVREWEPYDWTLHDSEPVESFDSAPAGCVMGDKPNTTRCLGCGLVTPIPVPMPIPAFAKWVAYQEELHRPCQRAKAVSPGGAS